MYLLVASGPSGTSVFVFNFVRCPYDVSHFISFSNRLVAMKQKIFMWYMTRHESVTLISTLLLTYLSE